MSSKSATSRIELGRRIKDLRVEKGLTAKDLAAHAGLSASYLSEVEKGISAISTEKLTGIAQHLGVTVDSLIAGKQGANVAAQEYEERIPVALAEAAERNNLTYSQTVRLLHGYRQLRARRSSQADREPNTDEWIRFFEKVKDLMEG